MTSYYNEIDKPAAAWLRELVKAGHIADGIVDERDIQDVLPSDLAGFTQCHFFAGIGVWSYALRKAGWPDDRPVWTGSCPCQPFSSAGKGSAFADERHLWPAFHHLIKECRPPVVFGEQVASKDADTWIDLVQTDMEAVGYAVGAVPFPAAGVGAPHIRDRLYWLADSNSQRSGRDAGSIHSQENGMQGTGYSNGRDVDRFGNGGNPDRMDNADDAGLEGFGRGHQAEGGRFGEVRPVAEASESCRVEYATGDGREQRGTESGRGSISAGCTLSRLADDQLQQRPHGEPEVGFKHDEGRRVEGTATITGLCGDSVPGPVNGRWSDADWLFCRDGKWRPVEPGTFPLVNGAAARVVRLRGYGNAINAVQAQAFIEAFMGYRQEVAA